MELVPNLLLLAAIAFTIFFMRTYFGLKQEEAKLLRQQNQYSTKEKTKKWQIIQKKRQIRL